MRKLDFVHSTFENVEKMLGKNTAVQEEGKSITYSGLNSRSNRLAHLLRDLGVSREYIVGVMMPSGIDLVTSLLSILKAGGVYLPMDISFSQKRFTQIFSHSRPKVVIVNKWWEKEAKEVIRDLGLSGQIVVVIHEDDSVGVLRYAQEDEWTVLDVGRKDYPIENPVVINDEDDGSYLFYTSGSTGEGKAILGCHKGLSHFIEWQKNEFNINEHYRVSQLTQLTFDPSLRDMFLPLCSGATVCIPPRKSRENISELIAWLDSSGITLMHCVPTLFRLITKELKLQGSTERLKSLRLLFLAGEIVYSKDILNWRSTVGNHVELVNLYGPTETTLAKFFNRIGEVSGDASQIVAVGKPISNTVGAIINDKHLCRVGEIGDIYIKTPFWSKGYYNNPELTASVFVQNPLITDQEDIVYKTGDIGRYLSDRSIEVLGRRDDQVKVNGIRVELKEIELSVLGVSGVEEVVIVAHRNSDSENELICYYTGKVDSDTIRGALKKTISENVYPSYFVPLEQFPVNLNGKIDKRALPKPEEVLIGGSEYEPVTNELEGRLEEIWKEVLGFNRIGRRVSFFKIGGTSLKALKVISRIQKEFNVKIAIVDLLSFQTIGQLAIVISDKTEKEYVTIDVIRDKQPDYGVSHAQKRIWIEQQLDPGSTAYTISSAYRLQGDLHVSALQDAFASLVERHESLRTTFVNIAGEPRQVIHDSGSYGFTLHYEDVSSQERVEDAVKALVQDQVETVFDLSVGPLLKAGLWQVNDREYVFSLTMHHIISDGWSMQVLVHEVLSMYDAYRQKKANPLEPLRIHYKDYAHWQQQQLQGEDQAGHKRYWHEQFTGEVPVLELPTDYARPAVKTYRGDAVSVSLEGSVYQGLKELSQRQGTTLFITLLAAVKALFYRYTEQEDIVIGTPVAGREHLDLENQIGFYVNMLPLRTRFSGSESFTSLLEAVKQTALGAYEHQVYPFDQLVDDLNYRRDMSRSPLFDIVVTLRSDEAPINQKHEIDHVDVIKYNTNTESAIYDLQIEFIETSEEIKFIVHYNLDLFNRITIERLQLHLLQFFKAVINGNTDLNLASYFSIHDKKLLIEHFNSTLFPYPDELTIVDLFERQVHVAPHQVAVAYQDIMLTYEELNKRSNLLAQCLRKKINLRQGEIVGLLTGRNEQMLIGMLGILKAGGAYLPLDKSYPFDRLVNMLEDANVSVVIGYLEGLGKDYLNIDLNEESFSVYSGDNMNTPVRPNDLAYVIYTSGSTGTPKGVLIEHRGVMNLSAWHQETFSVTSASRSAVYAAMSFDAMGWEIWPYLLEGASVYILTEEQRLNLKGLVHLLNHTGITHSFLPTGIWEALPEKDELDNRIVILTGGDKLRNSTVRTVINNYGPTEATVVATSVSLDVGRNGANALTIGSPIWNTQIYILDRHEQLVPVGIEGEIYIGGAGLSRGYLNRPELTSERFIDNPFVLGTKLYRTGDRGRWGLDGTIEYLGRKDHQVKVRGYRIELGEIEHALEKISGVDQAIVIAQQNTGDDQQLVAYLQGEQLHADEIRDLLMEQLPDYMIPVHFVIVDAFPLTVNGKLDTKALPAPQQKTGTYVAARSPIEQHLVAIWEDVLFRKSIGITDNFFAIGGHSIKAMQVAMRVYSDLGVSVGLKNLFIHPTIETLARIISTTETVDYESIKPIIDLKPDYELSHAQKRIWIEQQLDPGSTAYTISSAYRLQGDIHVSALQDAFASLVERHESLRTTFVNIAGEPRQVIHDSGSYGFTLHYEDVSSQERVEDAVKALVQDQIETVFDLSVGPLLKAGLWQVNDREYVFSLTMHHIISDGWSMQVLVHEVLSMYDAYRQKKANPLEPLRIHYKDYAHWQQQQLQGEDQAGHKRYWHEQFTGEVPVLELPTDYARPAVKTYRGDAVSVSLEGSVYQGLKELSQRQGTTLFITLLAAVKALFYRYTEQEDIVIGTPVAGREHLDLENQIGFYVNMLPLRTRFSGSESFTSLLEAVKQTALGAYEHQVYPFDQLVDDLNYRRDMSHSPLFDIIIESPNIELNGGQENGLQDVSITDFRSKQVESKFDLTISFHENEDDIDVRITYNKDLFSDRTLSVFGDHLKRIITSITENNEVVLARLPYLSLQERNLLVHGLNDTAKAQSNEITIVSLFEDQARIQYDSVAVIYDDKVLTYGELNRKANQLAHRLQAEYKVGKGGIVGVVAARNEQMLINILAILKAGAAYLPLDTDYPDERLAYMLRDANVNVIVGDPAQLPKKLSEKYSVVTQESGNVPAYPSANTFVALSGKDLSYLLYTSGSTGKPKGVMVEHGSLMNYLTWADQHYFQWHQKITFGVFTPLAFDLTLTSLFVPLLRGNTLFIISGDASEALTFAFSKSSAISAIKLTPSHLRMVKHIPLQETQIQCVIVGGEALREDDVNFLRALNVNIKIHNEYGPTEATVGCTANDVTEGNVDIGGPIWNTSIYILDRDQQLVPVGIEGEICIGGSGLARGYLNQPELTGERFVENPFNPGNRLYRTGDRGRWLLNGAIEYLGRKDQQVKIRGYRIELPEIEHALTQISEVEQAVVIASKNATGDQHLIAYVQGVKLNTVDFRTQLLKHLPDYMIPGYFVMVDALPLTVNGKLDVSRLPAPQQQVVTYVAARTPVEHHLVSIWEEVLSKAPISVIDNFFALGGDSIKAMQVAARMHKVGYKLEVRHILQQAILENVALQAHSLNHAVDQQPVEGEVELTPIQHYFFDQKSEVASHYNQALLLRGAGLTRTMVITVFRKLIEHHDALRMIYEFKEGAVIQINRGLIDEVCVEEFDYSGQPEEVAIQQMKGEAEKLQSSLKLRSRELLKIGLFHLPSSDRLLIVIHHLVIDGVSWRILLEDIGILLQQYRQGDKLVLQAKTDSYQHWAKQLKVWSESQEISHQKSYWLSHEQHTDGVMKLLRDHPDPQNYVKDTTSRGFLLSKQDTAKLLTDVHSAYHTEINDVLLTGLALSLQKIFGGNKVLIELEGHGREEIARQIDVTRTVGWFTSLYPVVFQIDNDNQIGHKLIEIKEQLRRVPQRGIGYGVLRYLHGSDYQWNLSPQLRFNYLGQFDSDIRLSGLEIADEASGNTISEDWHRDRDWELSALVTEGQLNVSLHYNKTHYKDQSIERFLDQYKLILSEIIQHCINQSQSLLTPSDLTLKRELTISQVKKLYESYPIEDIYELSPLQEGLLFHFLQQTSKAYFVQISYKLKSTLKIPMVRESLQRLMKRHTILRTVFSYQELDQPLQIVLKDREADFTYVDLRGLSGVQKTARVKSFLQQDCERGFDLTRDALMRIGLVQTSENEYELVWSHHHIVMDGWCSSILTHEFWTLYRNIEQGTPAQLKPIRPYKDYIRWLQNKDQKLSLGYWSSYLSGYNTTASLAQKRIDHHEFIQQSHQIVLPKDLSKDLQGLSVKLQATLNTILESTWGILLGRYTGACDVVFGSVVSGRSPELIGVEEMVGLFINTIPVRVSYTSVTRVDELIRHVQQQALESQNHHHCQLAQIQAETELGQRLFDHILVFENYPVEEGVVDLSHNEPLLDISDVSVFDHNNYGLTVVIIPGDQLRIKFVANSNIYDREFLIGLSERFMNILTQVTENAFVRIDAIKVISEEEEHRLLKDFNKTVVRYQAHKTIHEIFEKCALEAPESTAILFYKESLTYRELNDQANTLAQHLRENFKVRPNDIIAIMADRSVRVTVSILGILKAGGAYLFIDPSLPEERKRYILSNAGVKVLLVDSPYMFDVGFFQGELFTLDIELPALPLYTETLPCVNTSKDLAYVIYTSGSTGEPKGVLIEHAGVVNLAAWQRDNFKITASSRILQYFSYSFDGAVGETFMALMNGACLCMLNKGDLIPGRIIDFINKNKISVAVFVPSFLKELAPDGIENADFTVVSVGEVCPVSLAFEWSKRCNFMNAYGPTEYTVYSHLLEVDTADQSKGNKVPIGKPIHNTKSYILDQDHRLMPVGCVGELYLSGAGMARGYLKNVKATAEKFVPNPFFLKDKYIDHGKLSIKSIDECITSFKKEALALPVDMDQQELPQVISPESISTIVSVLDEDLIEFTNAYITRYAENEASFQCFCRYLLEGFNHTYNSSSLSDDVLRTILACNNFNELKGIDFGFGNANVMKNLRRMGATVKGFDISPFFVQQARTNGLDVFASKVDLDPQEFMRQNNLQEQAYDFVISTLLLDRLENPKNLIKNMMLVLKPQGRLAIQTLLPIIPVDDGDVKQKIVYTPLENRITSGENVEDDKLRMIQLLHDCGLEDIQVCEIPYAVYSRDGLQEYNIWSFYGQKSSAVDTVENCYSTMYRTGDLARYMPDGNIEFYGRVDEQVKIRGFRVELEEIENALSSYSGINNCAVLLHEDKQGERYLAAYYTADAQHNLSELRQYLINRLPDYMIPGYFIRMENFPVTSAGKINRKALPLPETSGVMASAPPVAPGNPIESELVEIWKEVLGKNAMGVNDNFFANGGDSIKSIRIVVAVEKRIGIPTTIGDVFTHQTIRKFSEFVSTKKTGSGLRDYRLSGLQRIEELKDSILNDALESAKLPEGYADFYPISPIEAGMIYSSLLRPEDPVYYEQVIYNYRILDIKRFLTAFELLIQKHDIYRTRFYINRFKEPLKVVIKNIDTPIYAEDLSMLPAEEQINIINTYASQDLLQRLTFDGELLWKLKLFKIDSDHNYAIVQSMHHAISDGWSNSIFIKEFSGLLNRSDLLNVKSLPALKHSYKDYCAVVLGRQASENSRNYWKEKLNGYTRNKLPFNFSGKRKQALNQLGRVNKTMSKELLADLEQIEFNQRVSFQSICLSAYTYWMHLICSENDVVVGIVSHDRPAIEDGDKILGTFLNTIPFRIDLSELQNGLSLIKRVNDYLVEIKTNEIHLSEIISVIGEKAFVGNPIFDCIFNYTDFYELENLYNEVIHQTEKGSNFVDGIVSGNDMTNTLLDLEITRTSGIFNVSIKYARAYFEQSDVEYALSLYVRILEQFARDAASTLRSESLLSEVERNRILYEFNDTVSPYSEAQTLHGLFEAQVQRCPDQIAVFCGDHHVSYDELNTKANRLAHYLISEGLNNGDHAGVLCSRSPEMIIALLAILKAGASYVPIDQSYPQERQQYMLSNSKVKVVLTDQGVDNSDEEAFRYIGILEGIAKGSSVLNPSLKKSSKDLAYTIYTSGSTGRPKGVMIDHHAAVNLVEWVNKEFAVNERDKLLFVTSVGFDLSVYDIFGTLSAGGSLVIASHAQVQDVGELQRLMQHEQITFWDSVPTTMHYLVNELHAGAEEFRQDRLRVVFLSGDWIGVSLPDRITRYFPQAKVISLGGATEGTVWSNYYPITAVAPSWASIPYGRPIANNFFYILDNQGNPVPEGVAGELYIGGVGVARGYANEVEKTASAFVPDRFNTQLGGRMYRTGDLGRLLRSGEMEFLGRCDHQVKIRGFRVELGEIESQLRKIDGVKEALVEVFKGSNGSNTLCAYTVSEEALSPAVLSACLSGYLPGYMVPSHYIGLEKMPLNSNGKLDRRLLPRPELNASQQKGQVEARTELESKLVTIWESILGVQGIGVTEDLLERGAHSLNLGAFVNRASRQLGVVLNLREVFEHTTVEQLARLIQSKSDSVHSKIEPVLPEPHYALSHAQKRLWIEQQINPESIVYNISGAYRLDGEVGVSSLGHAFAELVSRHESLRTIFIQVDGSPRQQVREVGQSEFSLRYRDLRGDADAEEKVRKEIHHQGQSAFDLSQGPLLRADLWQLTDDNYVVALTMHHIISDGWSMQVLLDELMVLYDSYEQGLSSPLKPLRIHYKDYANWQRAQLEGASLAEHQRYWHEQFSGDLPVLALPTDYERPPVKTSAADRVSLMLDAPLTQSLKELSHRHGATLFMTIVAAVKALLYRYTGQEDIVIGTPVAGRDHEDLDNQIGFYINMLALRTQFSGSDTFEQLLGRVKETMLGAYQYQVYPFDRLVEELPLKRDMSRSPLFDVVVVMQNTIAPVSQVNELANIKIQGYDTGFVNSIIDLRLECTETSSGLLLNLDYNKDLFEKESAYVFVRRLEKFFETIDRSDACSITDANIQLPVESEANQIDFDVKFDF